nr:sialate O-acetylesterase [Armatimonadota bacterium]
MGRWMNTFGAVLMAVMMAAGVGRAEVKLPHVFGSHMVLQRDQPVPIWGWADAGEDVSVTLGDGPAVTTKTDAAGKWTLNLPAHAAGGPFQLTVKGKNTITLDDVLVGDVWLCSGQSNMQFTVSGAQNAAADIAKADEPQIRQFAVPDVPAGSPAPDVQANWVVSTPATAGSFTAAGFFMARELHKELGVPIGLINSSWGGTRIEPWIAPEGFAMVKELKPQYDQLVLTDPHSATYQTRLADYLKALDTWMTVARAAMPASQLLDPAPAYPTELRPMNTLPSPEQQLSTLYYGMIYPVAPYGIRGAIWYQGESNHGEGMAYTPKMRALIEGWRKVWGEGVFPFYFVQIAPYNYGGEPANILPEFWEAQAAALAIPNTGMAQTNDIGNVNNIHPTNKQEVGHRLALLALAGAYGRKGLVTSGPTFKSMTAEGNHLRIRFDNVGGGLASRDGKPLDWFQVIGEDTDFVDATATIDGDAVLVSAPQVAAPKAVTFGWNRNAEPNLMNKEGLPGLPFRAGKVPTRDYLALKVPEAKDYRLVYDLDLSKLAHDITYDVDDRAKVAGPFDRIAYFLELQKPGEPVQYVYASMDAFTTDLAKIGIPTLASGAVFQQKVKNVNVISNAAGIVNGNGLQGCNIEFWPHNYDAPNTIGIPNASNDTYDFGDHMVDPADGYGSMQVHNYEAKQTLFGINHWVAGPNADLGIGNSDGKSFDWTFAANGAQY